MYANDIETKEKYKLPEIKKLATTCTMLNIQILLSLLVINYYHKHSINCECNNFMLF